MKKILMLSACILGLGLSSPADAMMKKPNNMCEFLQYMDQKMDVMASAMNQRLDQMDNRLNQMEKAVSFATTKAYQTGEDVQRIKQTIGSFDSKPDVVDWDSITKKECFSHDSTPQSSSSKYKTENKRFYHRKTKTHWESPLYKHVTWRPSCEQLLTEIGEADIVTIVPLEDYSTQFQTRNKPQPQKVWDPHTGTLVDWDGHTGYRFSVKNNVISKVPASLARYLFEKGSAEIVIQKPAQ